MSRYVFDVETDGLLDTLTKIHSLVLKDIDTGTIFSFASTSEAWRGKSIFLSQANNRPKAYRPIEQGLELLSSAELIVGHNIIDFDIRALKKVYPSFKPRGLVRDTLLLSRLIKADSESFKDQDFKLAKRNANFPKKLIGRHSLEAWGYRLGNWKGDYAEIKAAEAKANGIKDKAAIIRYVWGVWNEEMQTYCEQDCEVTLDLWKHFSDVLANGWSEETVDLEHEVAWVISRQTAYGIGFDTARAGKFLATLVGHTQRIKDELQEAFPPKTVETTFIPKVNNKKMGYVKNEPFIKRQVIPFNPGSRRQVAERLQSLGWKPNEYGKDGIAKVDDEVLSQLPYPEAAKIAEFYTVDKRIGALANGKQAWLKNERNGVIHPEVITNGAVTGRMTHRVVVNVPGPIDKKTGKPQLYGRECRELFIPRLGIMVGCDADSLEGRVMGGYMAHYDGGQYAQSVIAGSKDEGTDNHSRTRDAINRVVTKMFGLTIHRETTKTFFYALIYGAKDPKLGETLGVVGPKQKRAKVGGAARDGVMSGIPGLGSLVNALQTRIRQQGWIRGLDGRKLRIRKIDAALNTLFQSAGAILMKRALIILDTELTGVLPSVIGTQGAEAATKLVPGKDYEFVLNFHDEVQIDTRPDIATQVGKAAEEAIVKAGVYYNFKCPLKGNMGVGKNWFETH